MDGWVKIGTELDTKNFDAEIKYIEAQLEDIEDKLKKADMGFEVGDTMKLEAQYSRLIKQLDRMRKKQEDLNKTDLSSIEKTMENIGSSTNKTITRLGKWALGIFAVESAYGFVRQAVSSVSQYNEQIATDIEYIKYAVASFLQPLIEGMISLAYKLLTYVNYIAKAWFGIDLFANASADAMNKSAKSAEKMKKSLAGFDEMNVLNDNGTTGAMGEIETPSINLSQWQGEIPAWVQWIADNKDSVVAGLLGIAGAIVAINLGLNGFLGLGIGLIITGIATTIMSIIEFIKDPSWENFIGVLQGLVIVLTGVSVAMLSFNASNPIGWLLLAISTIVLLTTTIIENWDKIKEVLGKIASWVYDNIIKPIAEFFTGLWNGIIDGLKVAINFIKNIFYSVINFFKNIINTIVNLFKTIGTKVADVIGSAFKAVINGVLGAIENILNFPIKSINKLLDIINAVPGININKLPTFKLPRLAVGGIINMPNRGVPIGGGRAIGGEAGAEGVIPLTDSQAMETLGATIGKYININLTNITKLDNRQIAKEQKKINTQNDFAFNK